MLKTICPYCGGRCETIGGPDGNPYNQNCKEESVCTACGRSVSVSAPFQLSQDDTESILEEMMTDVDIIGDMYLKDIDMTSENVTLVIRIKATAEGGGVKRNAEITVPFEDGSYSLGNEYPFGRRDIDQNPPFYLSTITIKGYEISIAGETFGVQELPKIITKNLFLH